MSDLDLELSERLAALRREELYRELRPVDSAQGTRVSIRGKRLLNFSSNDYLGLANHPALKEAAKAAIERYGAGAGASRLICGSLGVHHKLDEEIAAFKGTAAALSFSTGYATALGAICAVMGKDDVVILDKLVHASIVDAARLCGAKLRVFHHHDLDDLEHKLKWAAARRRTSAGRTLVVTESVFSMDGDLAPLRELVALKEEYGAWLMVDEAHATGLYGARRRGLGEACGLSEHIEIQMGTLGKALGSCGGYICGSQNLIDYLVNRARTFIFSTAPAPAAAGAAIEALLLVQAQVGEERCSRLWQRRTELGLILNSLPRGAARWAGQGSEPASAIVPIPIGDERQALKAAQALQERGILIPAIRYPTVARGEARLRLTITAGHTAADLQELRAALEGIS